MKRLVVVLVPLLFGCGGSGDSSPDTGSPNPQDATLSIALSDAPADEVNHVVLQMHKIVLQPLAHGGGHHGDREPIELDISGHQIDMMSYQGEHAYSLLEDHTIASGRYEVHFHWHPGVGDEGSYVEDGLGKHPLQGQSGQFHVGDVMLRDGQHHRHTLELDLRQGLHHDGSGYHLDEHGMRWIDDSMMGHLAGTVDESWIDECEAAFPDRAGADSQFEHVAYLYPEDTALEEMDDMAPEAEEGKVLPFATSWVHQTHHGEWQFAIGFLPEGVYQLGYTCLGHLDQPDSNEIGESGFLIYLDGGELSIEAGEHGGHRNGHHMGG